MQFFDDVKSFIRLLDDNVRAFDAMIGQSVFESLDPKQTRKLERFLPVIPGIVLTYEKSDFAALSYIEKGYSECLIAGRSSEASIQHALRKSVLLRRRMRLESLSLQHVGPKVSDRRAAIRAAGNRRRHVRFLMDRPEVAIPILSNGMADLNGRCNATSTDVSLGGIGICLDGNGQLPSRNCVVGLQQEEGKIRYVNAYLRRAMYQGPKLYAGLVFQNETNDFLRPDHLLPEICPVTKRFECRLSREALRQWCDLGVLNEQLLRRMKTCPECHALSTFGTGCRNCGSFQLSFQDLIHHFACAHVDQAMAFKTSDTMECPKCLCSGLVVGADFEVIRSRYACHACGYLGDETAMVGHCLNCQLRFPFEMAYEVEVNGYHVDRLDVLALVDSAR